MRWPSNVSYRPAALASKAITDGVKQAYRTRRQAAARREVDEALPAFKRQQVPATDAQESQPEGMANGEQTAGTPKTATNKDTAKESSSTPDNPAGSEEPRTQKGKKAPKR